MSRYDRWLRCLVFLPLLTATACSWEERQVSCFLQRQAETSNDCVTASARTCLYALDTTEHEQALSAVMGKIASKAYSRADVEKALAIIQWRRANVLDQAAWALQIASLSVPKLAAKADALSERELKSIAAAILANYDKMLSSADKLLALQYRHSRALEDSLGSLLKTGAETDPSSFEPLATEMRSSWQELEKCVENEGALNAAFCAARKET